MELGKCILKVDSNRLMILLALTFYLEFTILFQFPFDDFDGRIYWYRCKQCSDIIGGDAVSILKLYLVDLVYKVLCIFYVMGNFPKSGLRTLANSFATSKVAVCLVETIDLRRMSLLCIRDSIEFRGTHPCGLYFLYEVSLIHPSALIFLSRLINLFFCLLVGSTAMDL